MSDILASVKYELRIHVRKTFFSGRPVTYHSGYDLLTTITTINSETGETKKRYEVRSIDLHENAHSSTSFCIKNSEGMSLETNVVWDAYTLLNGNIVNCLDVKGFDEKYHPNAANILEGENALEAFKLIELDARLRNGLQSSGLFFYHFTERNCNTWTKYINNLILPNKDVFDLVNLNGIFSHIGAGKDYTQWGNPRDQHRSDIISELHRLIKEDNISLPPLPDLPLLSSDNPNIDSLLAEQNKVLQKEWDNMFHWKQGNVSDYLEITLAGKTYLIDGSLGNAFLNNQSGTEDNKLTILTGGGGDTVNNSGSHVTINTGSGEYTDSIVNGGSGVEINTGDGRDYINNTGNNTTITAGAGSDTIINSGDDAVINAGEGSDLIQDYGGGNTSIDLAA